MKAVFEAHQIAFPVVLLRNSFAVLDAPLRHKREKLGLPDALYFGRFDRIHVEALKHLRPTGELQIMESIAAQYQKLIDELKN